VATASDAGCALEMQAAMGDFVPGGSALFRILEGTLSADARDRVLACVRLGGERTHDDDPSYGLRKMVDIAERSVASSPFDDPTTTVMAIHRIHDCLRILAGRAFPSPHHRDSNGHVRLITRELDWPGYVRLAFDEIRLVGAGSPQVARRLRAALEDLKSVSAPERHEPLELQLELLADGVRRQFEDEPDVKAALTPDNEGIGSGDDVVVSDGRLRASAQVTSLPRSSS
jgi:uncharacterized membrane protein